MYNLQGMFIRDPINEHMTVSCFPIQVFIGFPEILKGFLIKEFKKNG